MIEIKQSIISICCITYNHEKYIRQTLDSFLMQKTNFEFEIVIHDDASTDNTANIIKEYEAKYPNIFNALYQIENQRSKYSGGMNPRFNYPRAKGKYIALCEGDDYWTDPYKLQKQVDFLEANQEYTGAYTDTLELKEGKLNLWRENLKPSMKLYDVINISSPFHTSSFLFRKEAINLGDFAKFVSMPSGDMVLFALVASKGALAKVKCEPTVYRKHEGGVTNSNVNKSISLHYNRIMLWEKMKEVIPFEHEKMDSVIIKHLLAVLKIAQIPLSKLINEIGHDEIIKLIGKKTLLKKILLKI